MIGSKSATSSEDRGKDHKVTVPERLDSALAVTPKTVLIIKTLVNRNARIFFIRNYSFLCVDLRDIIMGHLDIRYQISYILKKQFLLSLHKSVYRYSADICTITQRE